jgi:hypothetical protein
MKKLEHFRDQEFLKTLATVQTNTLKNKIAFSSVKSNPNNNLNIVELIFWIDMNTHKTFNLIKLLSITSLHTKILSKQMMSFVSRSHFHFSSKLKPNEG